MSMQELNKVEMNEVSGGATIAISNTAGMLDGTVINASPAAIINFVFGLIGTVLSNVTGLLGAGTGLLGGLFR